MKNILDQFGSIRAVIKIQTPPVYDPDTGVIIGRQLFGFDTAEAGGPADDLLAVSTKKRIEQPAGRFSLVFTPRQVWNGKTWADLIPPYSLCEIYMQRYPENEEPVLVMVGLTDAQIESDDYQQAAPQRTRQVTGYELSVLLSDQKILYLPVPPDQRQVLLTTALFSQTPDALGRTPSLQRNRAGEDERFLPPTASPELAAFASKDGGEKGMLAVDPKLATEGSSPIDVIDRVVRMLTVGTETPYNHNGLPLVNFDFPDARLRDLLFFDKGKATLFDPRAVLPPSAQITADTNLWNLLTTFSDGVFQELFTQSVDLSLAPPITALERALGSTDRLLETASPVAVEIVFRKKPFAGRINDKGELVGVADPNGSQFDRSFAASETVAIKDAVCWNLVRNSRDQNVTNTYLVYPRLPNYNSPLDHRAQIAPVVDADRLNPSSVRRFGPRLLEVQDVYLPPDLKGPLPFVELAHAREMLLWAWRRFGPLFRSGRYTIRGNTRMRVGKRGVHETRDFNREYYLEGVGQNMNFGKAPRFITTLDVERGWPLQG